MSHHYVDVHVGGILREIRKSNGMSQKALGEKVGVTFQQIQKYEKGINRIGASMLFIFSTILNVKISVFFNNVESNNTVRQCKNIKETRALILSYNNIDDKNIRKNLRHLMQALGNKT